MFNFQITVTGIVARSKSVTELIANACQSAHIDRGSSDGGEPPCTNPKYPRASGGGQWPGIEWFQRRLVGLHCNMMNIETETLSNIWLILIARRTRRCIRCCGDNIARIVMMKANLAKVEPRIPNTWPRRFHLKARLAGVGSKKRSCLPVP